MRIPHRRTNWRLIVLSFIAGFSITAGVGLLTPSCASAPPNLSSRGQAAFQAHRVVKALDALRDVAIDANKQTPPLVSTDITRRVVLMHRGALTAIDQQPVGWQASVVAGLDGLDAALTADERRQLGPFVFLAKTLIGEVPR